MELPRPSPFSSADRSPRILLYSHDSVGLGHLRRSLTLAAALRERMPAASILVATGSSRPAAFQTGEGIELVKLPSITKDPSGAYVSRELPLPLADLIDLRRGLLESLFERFAPDVLVVDHKVRGLLGELDDVLAAARARGTRTILGLRDVLDAPEVVAREWGGREERAAIAAYDRVLVYGAPEVFDPRTEYPIPPELGARLEFVGYVVRPHVPDGFQPLPRARDEVLVTCGGGDDGQQLVETYLESLRRRPRPWSSTLVLGPLFDAREARRVKREARAMGDVRVHLFYEDLPRLVDGADAVVAMAGYNTAFELVRSRKPTLLVPRTHPRREQLLRARSLERLGLAACRPDPQPDEIGVDLARLLANGVLPGRLPSLKGAARFAEVVAEELAGGVAAVGAVRRVR